MLADALADSHVQHERQKKISWFTSAGHLPKTPDEIDQLRLLRETDRIRQLSAGGEHDASRRIPEFRQHAAALDNQLRNPQLVAKLSSNQQHERDTVVYPPHPTMSHNPADADHLRFIPTQSDFFPNSKTVIDSRRLALAQFKQLCYFTLLRKRVEGRLSLLQRERGLALQRQQAAAQQAQAVSGEQSAPVKAEKPTTSHFGSLLLGGVLDPLPNPSQTSGFALSREVKQQVERRLQEAALRFEAVPQSGREQQQQHTATSSSASTGGGKKEGSNKRSRSSDKSSSKHSSKQHAAVADSKDDGDQHGGRSARFAGGFGGSSNLQMLQPARIGDLEMHPQMTYREPFQFRAQRMPRLPFSKHDYVVAGPKNPALNFAAGSAEVAEALSETVTPSGTARGSGISRGKRDASFFSPSSQQLQQQSSLSSVPQSEVPERFVLPATSVETFELPVVAQNHFRPPMAMASGVQHVLACRDFPPDFYTDVPSAPLQAARPSQVPPRHQPLRLSTLQLLFTDLPRTMADADPEDDLSDDEDHDLVDAGDVVEDTLAGDGGGGGGGGDDALLAEGFNNNSRPSTPTKKKNKTESEPAPQQVQIGASSAPVIDAKKAATYLSAPPLTLDDALSALSIVVPTSSTSSSSQQQQDMGAAAAASNSKRPPTPTKTTAKGGTASHQNQQQQQQGSLQNQQQQQRMQLVPPAVRSVLEKNAAERLAFTVQPVHSEDAFDENDTVARLLKASCEAFDRRRAAMPAHLQHLV